ncbi:hypothetical protein [Saccharospirillum salsuginis]|uniref:Lipoprotein n=1 Tax=Saccharospirillum salsuginis TaxID=418750 RepID=A0A918KPU8_9GAMM|nr:hypothetical protein [Saccharospirillum salsuginis]GGX70163.1 hypothetical protein GCM10007392_42250 [Saccharospirillum salsuginis]
MKPLIPLSVALLYGCMPGNEIIEPECTPGLDEYLCFPETHMQVVYEVKNTTARRILLGNPMASHSEHYPEGEGNIPHQHIELMHLENGYYPVPGKRTHRYIYSRRMDKEPSIQFTASMLFTENLLDCLSEEAYTESPFTGKVTYTLSSDNTLTCSEEQVISLLINYYRVTGENFESLADPEVGRPFTLTFKDETVPFDDGTRSYRRVTYHYRALQSQ